MGAGRNATAKMVIDPYNGCNKPVTATNYNRRSNQSIDPSINPTNPKAVLPSEQSTKPNLQNSQNRIDREIHFTEKLVRSHGCPGEPGGTRGAPDNLEAPFNHTQTNRYNTEKYISIQSISRHCTSKDRSGTCTKTIVAYRRCHLGSRRACYSPSSVRCSWILFPDNL